MSESRTSKFNVIVIKDFKCPSLNASYAGRHWTSRKAEADLIHSLVAISCRNQGVKPIVEFPIDIVIKASYKDNRRRDSGNVSNKELIDGLVMAKILPDDNTKYVYSVKTIAINGTGDNWVEILYNNEID